MKNGKSVIMRKFPQNTKDAKDALFQFYYNTKF